MKPPTQHRA